MKDKIHIPLPNWVFPAFSLFMIFSIYIYTFHLFDTYKLSYFLTQAFTHVVLLALILYLSSRKPITSKLPISFQKLEIGIYIILCIFFIQSALRTYLPHLSEHSLTDIGFNTQRSAKLLFRQGINPYQQSFEKLNNNPKQWGFKYGPVMIGGYGLSAYLPSTGIKLTNIIFLSITAGLIALLSTQGKKISLTTLPCVLATLTFMVIPKGLWYELLAPGVIDIFPIMLLLASVVAIRYEHFNIAGILTGLSFAAKFSPALFFVILLFRKTTPISFWKGVGIGLLPLAPFLIWDADALIQNSFLFHFVKSFDQTSLYYISPPEAHYLFPLIQIFALIYFFRKNMNQPIQYQQLLLDFFILYSIIELTYKQIHGNHLITFIPIVAILLAWARYKAFQPSTLTP